MLLSIVTGTYNRIAHLKAMVESVRDQIPRHIPYEFVVVDGGSQDGTLDWLAGQPDMRVIQHGDLKGAIKAFCDGAWKAEGDYVIMANDDILFRPNSIMRAVAYLESNPRCGAVAFADDRSQVVGLSGVQGHRVERMPAITPTGTPTMVNYAQVGLFRRWLGDYVGWWGAGDQDMAGARTYGGDNYLSAMIWEAGYTVDAVQGCMVDDGIARDELRQANVLHGPKDSKAYYNKFPRGPLIRNEPVKHNAQAERLRVLVMPIYEPGFPGRKNREYGLSEALASVGLTWEIDYINDEYNLASIVRAWQPHFILSQYHDANHITPDEIEMVRKEQPEAVWANWNGDAHERGLISPDVLAIMRELDLQLVVNAAVLPVYQSHGILADYWQIAFKDPAAPLTDVPAHDVLFLGNCYNQERYDLVGALQGLNVDFGLYGSCPGSLGNTHYDFARSCALYKGCKIAISDTFPDTEGFVSNRLFQAMSAGAFVLQQESPKLYKWTGLRAGTHYVKWRSLDEMANLVIQWLKPEYDKKREKIARQGMDYVRANYSYDAQVRKLWELLPT